jgi:SAM-dependent methyltransferase
MLQIMNVLRFKLRLLFKGRKRAIAFDLPFGELQFIQNIIKKYVKRFPKDIVCIVHNGKTKTEFEKLLPELKNKVCHISRDALLKGFYNELDIFITSEQYSQGVNGIYSICVFHGQPAKGLTFTKEIINSFDAFFLYGPLHRQAFEEFIKKHFGGVVPPHMNLYEIGCSKSDDLLAGVYKREDTLFNLGLNTEKKTVLYAPAFNEGASLQEFGLEIIKLISEDNQYNVIAKLPIDSYQPVTNLYATDGIDWFNKIKEMEKKYLNFRIYVDFQIDKILACSDVLITCVSSVGFEFFALEKPVIFIDTPKFFSKFLKQRFPDENTASWMNRTTVNGGKEFGLVVKDIYKLPEAIETVLSHPEMYPKQKSRLKKILLYNPGRATEAAVDKMNDLLQSGLKSNRPYKRSSLVANIIKSFLWRILIKMKKILDKNLNFLGYRLERTGAGYHDAKSTVAAAKAAGLSVCEYLESKEKDERKKGRRNSIIAQMAALGLFNNCQTVCEIGAGTGMYLEKVLGLAKPKQYEIYETNRGWVDYLKRRYSKSGRCTFKFHPADGFTLKYTKANSCDLVHAHAVFVYIPLLQVFEYLKEAARVCKPGGHVIFDCFLDKSFNLNAAKAWLSGPWRFPVIIPEKLLLFFAEENSLYLTHSFSMVYGSSFVDYLVFQKKQV